MPIIVRVMAMLLAVLWLPVSMHCDLARMEFSGALAECCDEHSCSGGDCGCQSDVCNLIEAGHYDLQRNLIALPLPVQDPVGPAASVGWRLRAAPLMLSLNARSAPPDVGPIWQFVFRAAPAPRSPSAAC